MAAPSIPLSRVLESTGATLVSGQAAAPFSSVTIDSRAVKPGALFVAVKGDRFDGHDFVAAAIAAGASGAIVARGRGAALATGEALLEVDDPVAALGKLARAHRMAMADLRVVGVTGSNGKTTTKDMIAAILASAAGAEAVLKTEGNLNNHLGVPLTLLRLTPAHRFAVVEMGMSNLGEIAYLSSLACPDVALIVSIAGVHLEQLGTIENVARAKAEIFSGLGPDGIAIYSTMEKLLVPHVAALPPARVRTFGPRAANPTVGYDDVQPGPKGLRVTLLLQGVTSHVGAVAQLQLIGAHNASNAAAAAAVAMALNVGEGSILDGLANTRPGKHRAQLLQVGERTVLDDCYNAAPPSMRAALDALVEVTPPGKKRIAVLGDMLELGADSPSLHAAVGEYAAARVDHLVTIGPLSQATHDAAAALGERRLHTDDPRAAAERVRAISGAGDVILVKASRGLRLERVIEALQLLEGEGA